MQLPYKRTLAAGASLLLALSVGLGSSSAFAQGTSPSRSLSGSIADRLLDAPLTVENARSGLDQALIGATGRQSVVVRLKAEPAAATAAARGDVAAQYGKIRTQQERLINLARGLDPSTTVVARTSKLINAVFLDVDAARLPALAADVDVVSVNKVADFELDLSETVPYIGASAVQAQGVTGDGVTVAVLDSGIDYTHAHLSGGGTLADYEAAYGTGTADPRNTTNDGLFPTAKVVAGYDFVGEAWPNGPLAPDEDPIDFEGHGTHVADIIGGTGGVAPDVDLVAVKVCSAVSSSCSGVALIQGMEFSADPNGDGDFSDAVDIINMSLGSVYGVAFNDDLSFAVENASSLGILTVASAGNSADRPYVLGTPSAAPSALAVAQTQVPGAVTFPLVVNSPASIAGILANTETLAWAPVGAGFAGDVAFVGRGCNADPYLADPAGKVALIDRGACNISEKVRRASDAGATAVLIGLVAPGDAVTFSNGGDCPAVPDGTCRPSLVIIQSYANAIKGRLAAGETVNVSVSDAVVTPLVGSMVGSSSRGPSNGANLLKPEIGAPGASISAIAGTGTGVEPFGGTSGAAPMVSGAAALLLEANPRLIPQEVRARLVNTGETNIFVNPATRPGELAAVSRIGGGEVRVDRAINAPAAVWDRATLGATFSFGQIDVTNRLYTTSRRVTIRNYSNQPITYNISTAFRFQNDADNGAVSLRCDPTVTVPARGSTTAKCNLRIDGTKLRPWTMNSGAAGANPAPLTLLEYDGYVYFTDASGASETLHLPWQVLPRQSGNVSSATDDVRFRSEAFGLPATYVELKNSGIGAANIEAFSLMGTSPNKRADKPGSNQFTIDLRAFGVRTTPVPAGFCSADESFVMEFAFTLWERQSLANFPAGLVVALDTNNDGTADYEIYNADLGFPSYATIDGRAVTYAVDLATGSAQAFFFTGHSTNSANYILTICGEQIGMNAANLGQPMGAAAIAYDSYSTGAITDEINDLTIIPGGERYGVVFNGSSLGFGTIPARGSDLSAFVDFGAEGTNPAERGILLLNTGVSGGASSGAPEQSEALIIIAGKGR